MKLTTLLFEAKVASILFCLLLIPEKIMACDYIVTISANPSSPSMTNDTICFDDGDPVPIYAVHLYNFTTYFNDPVRQLIWTRDGIPFDTTNQSQSIFDGSIYYVTTLWVTEPGNYQVWYFTPNHQLMQFGQVSIIPCNLDIMPSETGQTSIEIDMEEDQFRLFPNPSANGYAMIESNLDMVHVECFDYGGKKIFDLHPNGESSIYINTSGWKSGIYIVQLLTTKGILREKLIIP